MFFKRIMFRRSSLHQSNLYSDDKDFILPLHDEDHAYLDNLISNVKTSLNSKKEWNFPSAETTFSENVGGYKYASFEILYHGTRMKYEYYPLKNTINDLVVDILSQPQNDLSQSVSWMNQNPKDYIIKLLSSQDYIFLFYQKNINLENIVEIRKLTNSNEKIRMLLIEKASLEIDRSLSSANYESVAQTMGISKGLTFSSRFMLNQNVQHISDTSKTLQYEISLIDELLNNDEGFNGDIIYTLFTFPNISCKDRIEVIKTKEESIFNKTDFDEEILLDFDVKVSSIPREACVAISIHNKKVQKSNGLFQSIFSLWNMLSDISDDKGQWWCIFPVFDYMGMSSSTPHKIKWHQSKIPNIKSLNYQPYLTSSSLSERTYSIGIIRSIHDFIYYKQPKEILRYTSYDWDKIMNGNASSFLIWEYRHHIALKVPEKLLMLLDHIPVLTSSFDSNYLNSNTYVEHEIGHLLMNYPALPPFVGLQLLAKYPQHYFIRCYAVECLKGLSDEELCDCMPQLIQCLKLEMYFSSPLCVFLLTRSLKNLMVGHFFYWYLNSESNEYPDFHSMFDILKRRYLELSEVPYRKELLFVNGFCEKLIYIASLAQQDVDIHRIRSYLQELKIPYPIRLPTCHKTKINDIIVEKCHVLQSNAKPLWLTFKTQDGDCIYIIVKIGDDIRIDNLALQLMKILDKFWKQNHLDLRLRPYKAMPLQNKVGMIQISTSAESISNINWKYGGNNFASAFTTNSLKAYLHTSNKPFNRKKAFRTFALSCSGYCVFTYIFGVGDRHSDNILCTKYGNIFHIDFGYFLGQRTTFFGFTRESKFVVLTPNYIQAMDEYFNLFVQNACKAYSIAQKHKETFKTFIELSNYGNFLTPNQVRYLDESFLEKQDHDEALYHFNDILVKSIQDKKTLLNDFTHLLATRVKTT